PSLHHKNWNDTGFYQIILIAPQQVKSFTISADNQDNNLTYYEFKITHEDDQFLIKFELAVNNIQLGIAKLINQPNIWFYCLHNQESYNLIFDPYKQFFSLPNYLPVNNFENCQ